MAILESGAKTTTDHETIRRWAEERKGVPALAVGDRAHDQPGRLRIHFSTDADLEQFQRIPWDDWLRQFDDQQLALRYEEERADGSLSRAYQLVGR